MCFHHIYSSQFPLKILSGDFMSVHNQIKHKNLLCLIVKNFPNHFQRNYTNKLCLTYDTQIHDTQI